MDKLRKRLEAMAKAERGDDVAARRMTEKREFVRRLEHETEVIERNLARATSDEQYRVVSSQFEDLRRRRAKAREELGALEAASEGANGAGTTEDELTRAMAFAETLTCSVDDPGDFAAAQRLFDAINVKLFVRFGSGRLGKRAVRKPVSGVITFGDAPPPIAVYAGPTSRIAVKEAAASSAAASTSLEPTSPGQEGDSLGNVSRGDKIRTCDLLDPNHFWLSCS
jgi:hypothetical protein